MHQRSKRSGAAPGMQGREPSGPVRLAVRSWVCLGLTVRGSQGFVMGKNVPEITRSQKEK